MAASRTKYQVGDRIGEHEVTKAIPGGIGEVYYCSRGGIKHALKTLQERFIQKASYALLEEEVNIWMQLGIHLNIVRCYGLEIYDEQPFIVLDLVPPPSDSGLLIDGRLIDSPALRDWMHGGQMELERALQIAIYVCHGLAHAQQIHPGLVHRDLKPENILVMANGVARITDFGLAKVIGSLKIEDPVLCFDANNLPRRSNQGGTPQYMAPEQWHGNELDYSTDNYAVGCIIYELLTGMTVFSGRTIKELREHHLSASPPKLPGSVPAELRSVVDRCLSKDRHARPQTALDLANELAEIYEPRFGLIPNTHESFERVREFVAPLQFSAANYSNRGSTHLHLGQFQQALEDFDQAILLDSKNVPAYLMRCRVYTNLRNYDKAIADVNRAIDLDPFLADGYVLRGQIYVAMMRLQEALQEFTKAIELAPQCVSIYPMRSSRERESEIAIATEYNLETAYYVRGRLYGDRKQYKLALSDFNEAIERWPRSAQLYAARAEIYTVTQEHGRALADYNKAIDLGFDGITAYAERARLYFNLERWSEALEDFDKVISMDPTLPSAYCYRGVVRNLLERTDDAISDFNQALVIDPENGIAHFNLAVIFQQRELDDMAMYHYYQAYTGAIERIVGSRSQDELQHVIEERPYIATPEFLEYLRTILDLRDVRWIWLMQMLGK